MQRMLSILLLLVTVFAVCIQYEENPEFAKLHQVLSTFHEKGQLLLERLPPLSLGFPTSNNPQQLIRIDIGARFILIALVVSQYLSNFGRPAWPISFVYIACSSLWCLWAPHAQTRLQVCNIIGACFVQIVILLATRSEARSFSWLHLGLPELCLTGAYALGSNAADIWTSFLIVYCVKISSLLRKTPKSASAVIVMAWCCLITVQSLALPAVLWLGILALTYTGSEIAAGGNYNLHYLSAQARRDLSPAREQSQLTYAGNFSVPRHAIAPYIPVSLYLEQAGFLWHDESTWLPEYGVFGESNADIDESNDETVLQRVYFSDPIGRRHPWAFEQDVGTSDYDDSEEHGYVSTYLWSGEYVYLRSRVTDRYLSVAGGNGSLIDEEMGILIEDNRFARLEIGLNESKSEHGQWVIEYDPSHDEGFRLFNPKYECYLASSFRQFPDWDNEQGNDTISKQLNMVNEATCTQAASNFASTLYVIEGTLSFNQTTTLASTLPDLMVAAKEILTRGYHIGAALISLQRSRSIYGDMHDVPKILLQREATTNSVAKAFELWLLVTCCLAHIFLLLWSKRRPSKEGSKKGGDPVAWVSPIVVHTTLVYSHLTCYYVYGASRPSGGVNAMLTAILALGAMWNAFYFVGYKQTSRSNLASGAPRRTRETKAFKKGTRT